MKLLFARIGRTYSPILGKKKKIALLTWLLMSSFDLDSKWLLLAPIHLEEGRKLEDKLKALLQQICSILVDNQMIRLDEIDQHKLDKKDVMLIIDRIVVKAEEEFYNRLADAVQTAFYEGKVSVIYKN
jgi:excinuclease ABC subunit A